MSQIAQCPSASGSVTLMADAEAWRVVQDTLSRGSELWATLDRAIKADPDGRTIRLTFTPETARVILQAAQ